MEIVLQSTVGPCTEYRDKNGKRCTVSVVIAPLKADANDEQTKVNIKSGCNLWQACQNEDCYLSNASRRRKKEERAHKDN